MKPTAKKYSVFCVAALSAGVVLFPLAVPRLSAQVLPLPPTPGIAAPIDKLLSAEELSPLVGGPTLVTLQGEGIPLSVAVTELLQAAHLPTEPLGNRGKDTQFVTVNWKNTPFWEAAKDLEQQTGSTWAWDSTGARLLLSNIQSEGGVNSLLGEDVSTTPLVTLIAHPPAPQLTRDATPPSLNLSAYFDPHFKIVRGSDKIELEGFVRPPDGIKRPYTSLTISHHNAPVSMSFFRLPLGDHTAQTKIPLVKGTLTAQVIREAAKWEVNDITAHPTATYTINDTTYHLDEVTLDGMGKLTIKTSSRTLNDPNYVKRHDAGNVLEAMQLIDGQGQVVPGDGFSIFGEPGAQPTNKAMFGYSLRLDSFGAALRTGPFKLVWSVPTQVQTLKVPFELHDVAVP